MANHVASIKLWHKHFKHLSYQSLQLLSNDGRVNMIPKLSTTYHVHVCGGWMTRKKTKQEIPKFSNTWMIVQNAFICCNLCEPLSYASLRGSQYFINFTDDVSKKTWVYFMKEKNQSFQRFQAYLSSPTNLFIFGTMMSNVSNRQTN